MPASAPAVASTSGLIAGPVRRYRAFISYSHVDTKWARWLIRRLETYAVPKRFHGRAAPIGEVGKRIAPVFRDRDELPTTSDLGETIRAALRESATLIVICSPAAARSRWVQEEIRAFKHLHGERRVFAFIVGGEPKLEGAADDCFSKALRWEVDADGGFSAVPAEVVAADARNAGDGPKLAFVRLVAGLLGVGFDELRQRELQRRNRRLTLVATASAAGMSLTLGLAVIAWQARNDARRRQEQAETVLTFMLRDFRGELEKVGQTQLLRRVGDKAMEYFDALDARDLTDNALALHAKALTQIGEVRTAQASYPDAVRAFASAYARAAALAARHPENGDLLFERGQAEYWIGFVHRRRGDAASAREWLTRYRDTAVALVALDPRRPAFRREAAYGHHNLAVLQFEERDLLAARAGFQRELEALQALWQAEPGDLLLRFNVADAHSWLGSTALRRGEFDAALAHYDENRVQLEALLQADPKNARAKFEHANSLSFRGTVRAMIGDLAGACAFAEEARDALRRLCAEDPDNRAWKHLAVLQDVRLAGYYRAQGDRARASAVVEDARRELETLVAAAPADRRFRGSLLIAQRLIADLQHAAGNAEALATALASVESGELLVREGKADDTVFIELAQSCLSVARLAAAAGQRDTAAIHLSRAWAVLAPRQETLDSRLLDALARTHALAGRTAESRAIIGRLEATGYRPLHPWPTDPLPLAP